MSFAEINERSYGVIPLMVLDKTLYVFMVQHYSGAWLLPKGHAEQGENEQQAATRELKEETGLHIERWLNAAPFIEQYEFVRKGRKIFKEVQYFPALVGGSVVLQQAEVKAGRWVKATEASDQLSFSQMRHLMKTAISWIQSNDEDLQKSLLE